MQHRASDAGSDATQQNLIVIRPGRRFEVGIREFWAYRELLFFLTWRDVKVRYQQTVLGASWAVLQPLMMMVVLSVFLGHFAHVPSAGLPYPVFAFAGLVPWTLFSQSLAGAANSLVDNSNLVSKVYFPRLILPLAQTGAFVIDFLIAMAVLLGLMLAYGLRPHVTVFWTPLLTLHVLLIVFGVGLWLASLNVRYRDVRHAIPLTLQLWLFASPVAFSSTIVPNRWRWLIALNPVAGLIDGFRWALFGGHAPTGSIFLSLLLTVVIVWGGLLYFRATERTFADWI